MVTLPSLSDVASYVDRASLAHISKIDSAGWTPAGDSSAGVAVLVAIGIGLLAAYAAYSVQDKSKLGALLWRAPHCACGQPPGVSRAQLSSARALCAVRLFGGIVLCLQVESSDELKRRAAHAHSQLRPHDARRCDPLAVRCAQCGSKTWTA